MINSCENRLLLLPKITPTATITKTHLRFHPQHHYVQLHFSPLKAHFKSTLPTSPPAADSSSSSLTTTTVDFLMDSGGLSYMQAIQVIREVPTFLNNGSRKLRSVITYLESIGFSKTHISKTISKCPRLLVADVEKTLKPKIQIFQDLGFSESDIADLIVSEPHTLTRGVKKQIKPVVDLIQRFVKTDEELIKTIKRNRFLLISRMIKYIEPNIEVLRQHGVPDSEIVHLVLSSMCTLMSTTKVFKRIVKKAVSLGFKPETRKFLNAVCAMARMSKPVWDSKIDLLKGLGWSDEQILNAFGSVPRFMTLSGENLKESIEFYKETLNWDASVLSQYPILLAYSLKKRVIPRYAVLKCLMSKEIIKKNKPFNYMLRLTETKFLSVYVFKYQDQLPYLYEVYEKECMLGCKEDSGDIEMTV